MSNVNENKMGTAPILPLVFQMSLPAIFSMLVQALYNIVDSIFVSRLGEGALTAVSLAFPIQMVLIAVGAGTGIGINSLVSRKLGEKEFEYANKTATHGLLLSIISGILFMIIGVSFSEKFISLFTKDAEIIKMGADYLVIVCAFSFGIFMQVTIEKILQATGNMILPMITMLIGAITNIILDPIFIFGYFGVPKLGVKGAAVATVIGQIAAMIVSIFLLFLKKHEVHIKLKGFKIDFSIIKNIYLVGFPAIVMQCIGSVMVTALNGILSMFTQTAVAVFGIYFKLQSFVFMPVFGLTQGLMPIMGYNYGAKNKKRLTDTIKIGIAIAVIIMSIGVAVFMLIPDRLLLLFDASEQMLKIGIPALRIISINFIMAAMGIVISNAFQAVGIGINSLIISILRQLAVLLPAAYVLSFFGLSFVWWAFPLSETVSLVLSIFMYISVYNKKIKNLSKEE